jgi:hypothetical protein
VVHALVPVGQGGPCPADGGAADRREAGEQGRVEVDGGQDGVGGRGDLEAGRGGGGGAGQGRGAAVEGGGFERVVQAVGGVLCFFLLVNGMDG